MVLVWEQMILGNGEQWQAYNGFNNVLREGGFSPVGTLLLGRMRKMPGVARFEDPVWHELGLSRIHHRLGLRPCHQLLLRGSSTPLV